jgi:gamma-glutamylcyclotransferase (GGCT)/AIG2-like uncharacterized protein YtfP
MPEADSLSAKNNPLATPPAASHVFVYGTLRRGDDNDITRLTPPALFIGMARVRGVMHHLGGYPGVLLEASAQSKGLCVGDIVGEVYRITPELERKLDEIEALYPEKTDEYFKRFVSVHVNGESVECIVYEINPAYCQQKPILASGDWVQDRHV